MSLVQSMLSTGVVIFLRKADWDGREKPSSLSRATCSAVANTTSLTIMTDMVAFVTPSKKTAPAALDVALLFLALDIMTCFLIECPAY